MSIVLYFQSLFNCFKNYIILIILLIYYIRLSKAIYLLIMTNNSYSGINSLINLLHVNVILIFIIREWKINNNLPNKCTERINYSYYKLNSQIANSFRLDYTYKLGVYTWFIDLHCHQKTFWNCWKKLLNLSFVIVYFVWITYVYNMEYITLYL